MLCYMIPPSNLAKKSKKCSPSTFHFPCAERLLTKHTYVLMD